MQVDRRGAARVLVMLRLVPDLLARMSFPVAHDLLLTIARCAIMESHLSSSCLLNEVKLSAQPMTCPGAVAKSDYDRSLVWLRS
jgi:hypothetical protein